MTVSDIAAIAQQGNCTEVDGAKPLGPALAMRYFRFASGTNFRSSGPV